MRHLNKLALCSAVVWAVNAPAVLAQDTTQPSWGGTELYACTMNEGKGPGDLMKVVKKWNAWSDTKDIAPYFAWVLNPIHAWDADFERSAFWFGHSPSFTDMGEVAHTWLTEGGELRGQFNDVWTCNAHVELLR